MKIRSLAPAACVVVCVAVCVLASSASWGDNGPQSDGNNLLAVSSTTEKELLMYFEEKDLVTATKRSTPLRKAPAIATIITAEEIRNMGARNLLDVLKMVPGLGVSINEFGAAMVEVRGIRTSLSEKILVMIDGHSLNKNITGSAFYTNSEMLPIENIKQVEVVRGPGSALYGSGAFVATINIITRDADEIDGLEVKAGGGSFDTYKGNIVGGKAFGDKLTVSGSLDHFKTNGPKLRVEADALTGTPFSIAPGSPDLSFRQTDAFLKIGYGDVSIRGGYRTIHKGSFIGLASALTDNSTQDTANYWGELAYGLRLADNLSSNLKIYYDHWEQHPYVKIFPNGFLGTFPDGMIGKPQVKDRAIGAEQQFDWEIFKGNRLIAGASYEVLRQYDVRLFGNYDPLTGAFIGPVQEIANWNKNATRKTWAMYTQDEWQVLERVNLTIGARYDHYSDFGGTVNPRAGLVWNFIDNADLKLLYGQAFRAPNFVELYNANNPSQLGNPSLLPEKIKTYEAGLAYRFAQWLAVDLNYFYSKIDNLIILDSSTAPSNYVNAGKVATQGVEMGLHGAAYENKIYWKLAYAYQNPRDDITGKRLPDVPSQRATGSINYAMNRYMNLHTNVLWTGPRPRAQGDTRAEMPSYTTVDVAATVKNFWKRLEVQAAIHNLFNKKFFDPDTSGTANKVPGDFPREGRSMLLSATYKF